MTVIIVSMVQAPPVSGPTRTRERLIAAAIEVFAEQGYEGARLQDIARGAGLTTGAIYANFRGKAELLFAAIGSRAGAEVDALLESSARSDTRTLLAQLGDRLPRTAAERAEPSLLVDALAAARRDDDLAALLRDRLAQREQLLSAVVARAKSDGTIGDAVSTDAFARFCTMLTTGALVLRGLGIEQLDPNEWHALIARLLDTLAPSEGDQ
jgi:AcrR family transcriptional regulator